MTDYSGIGLDSNLQPINAPISENEDISAYKFDSTNERGAVTSSFLAGIRDINGNLIVNKNGLTTYNFPNESISNVSGTLSTDGADLDWSNMGTIELNLSINTDKTIRNSISSMMTFSISVTGANAEGSIRLAYKKSTDGTTYTDDSYSYVLVTGSNNEYRDGNINEIKDFNYDTAKYWKIVPQGAIEKGTVVPDINFYYTVKNINYVTLGA